MFSKHVGIHATSIHSNLCCQDSSQSGSVEEGTTANDLFLRQAGEFLAEKGQYVDRIGHGEDDGVLSERLHVVRGRLQDCKVATQEVSSCLALIRLE